MEDGRMNIPHNTENARRGYMSPTTDWSRVQFPGLAKITRRLSMSAIRGYGDLRSVVSHWTHVLSSGDYRHFTPSLSAIDRLVLVVF
jgi:hypothetical protein